jgi:hypothetical protein
VSVLGELAAEMTARGRSASLAFLSVERRLTTAALPRPAAPARRVAERAAARRLRVAERAAARPSPAGLRAAARQTAAAHRQPAEQRTVAEPAALLVSTSRNSVRSSATASGTTAAMNRPATAAAPRRSAAPRKNSARTR